MGGGNLANDQKLRFSLVGPQTLFSDQFVLSVFVLVAYLSFHGGARSYGRPTLQYGLISHLTFCFMLQLFAYAAQEHSAIYGSTLEQCAKIAYKNHKHSIHNPHASLRKEIPLKRICKSRMICKPITLTMSAPTADGSAAAVVCSRDFMEFRGMQVSFKFAYMRAKT